MTTTPSHGMRHGDAGKWPRNTTIHRLDWVIYNAGLVGIRVVVCLTNDLSDFGGKPCASTTCVALCVHWHHPSQGMWAPSWATAPTWTCFTPTNASSSPTKIGYVLPHGAAVAAVATSLPTCRFTTSPTVLTSTRAWCTRTIQVRHCVHTTTLVSAQLPTAIFSWNLINEPAVAKDFDQRMGVPPGTSIANWVAEMSAFMKEPAQDPNHLLSVGDVRAQGDRYMLYLHVMPTPAHSKAFAPTCKPAGLALGACCDWLSTLGSIPNVAQGERRLQGRRLCGVCGRPQH